MSSTERGDGSQYPGDAQLVSWATKLGRLKLADNTPRLAHLESCLAKAETVAGIVGDDADLLRAAIAVHDVGHASSVRVTGCVPLDGARFLQSLGAPPRLVNLVMGASGGKLETELRGYETEAAEFDDEQTPLRDALWYCCLTTGLDGTTIALADRLANVRERYAGDDAIRRWLELAEEEVSGAVDRTEQRLSASVGA